jgi:hypothetical protein
MTIMGLDEKKKRPSNGLGVGGLSGDDDDMYYPVFGAATGNQSGGATVKTPITPAQQAVIDANKAKTAAIFAAAQAEVDRQAKNRADAQAAAVVKATADAQAKGKSQAEIDKAVKDAQLSVLLKQPIVVAPTPDMSKPPEQAYDAYKNANTPEAIIAAERAVQLKNQQAQKEADYQQKLRAQLEADQKAQGTTDVPSTGPIVPVAAPDMWTGLEIWIANWNKGWADFFTSIKTTLGIK